MSEQSQAAPQAPVQAQPAPGQVVKAPVQVQTPGQSPVSKNLPGRSVGESAAALPDVAAKKAAAIAMLRGDRGVPAPAEAPKAVETAPVTPAAAPATPAVDPMAKFQAEWAAQQQALSASEKKSLAAQAAAEQKAAEADAKLKKLELAAANPVEFLSEVGMTQEEWSEFLTSGGKLSPEQKRTRELEKSNKELAAQVKQMMENQQKSQADMMARFEADKFAARLDTFPVIKHIGGVGAVQAKAAELAKAQGGPVSYEQAATVLQQQWVSGLKQLLQDSNVRDILGISSEAKPQTEPAGQSPSTLSSNVTSSTAGAAPTVAPTDFAAKRKLLLQRLQEMQAK